MEQARRGIRRAPHPWRRVRFVARESRVVARAVPAHLFSSFLASALPAVFALAAFAGEPPRRDGPFNVLEWRDGVVTSRDGYGVWVSVASAGSRVRLPGHAGVISDGGAALHVSCRAPGSDVPAVGSSASAHAGIFLDDHPEQRDAYTVLHPMYWILGLSGRAEERFSVQVRIAGGEPVSADLVRTLTNYSAPRPGLDIELPLAPVFAAFEAGGEVGVEVRGSGVSVDGSFVPSANARRAAALMRVHCYRPQSAGFFGGRTAGLPRARHRPRDAETAAPCAHEVRPAACPALRGALGNAWIPSRTNASR